MKTALLALTLTITTCGQRPDSAQESGPPSLEAARGAAAQANEFGFDLFRRLRVRDGNLFVSPYSIATALAMAREGADGETLAQLNTVLHTVGSEPGGAYRDLARLLEPRRIQDGHGEMARLVPAHELHVANRVWLDDGLELERPFTAVLDRVYGSPVERIDFGRPDKARERINRWVSKETRERIRGIVPEGQPSADTLLVLANAIYFKAGWQKTFHEGATREGPFHRTGSDDVQVQMMRMEDHFAYAEGEGVQAIELPYRGRETSMIVFLPTHPDGLAAFEDGLDSERLDTVIEALESRRVSIQLPRFEFTSTFQLSDALRACGIKDAFESNRADFSRMGRSPGLAMGSVLHKAFVAVDENGTEAAAATAVALDGKAIEPDPPIPFIADHPFLFVIRHRKTGCILFLGRVEDPSI